MAIKKSYVGGQVVAWDENGKYPDTGESLVGFKTEGQMLVAGTPVADTNVVRLVDLTNRFPVVDVEDITDPSAELSTMSGTNSSPMLIARQIVSAGDDLITLYFWVENYSSGESVPFYIAGATGFWLAIAGQYVVTNSVYASAIFGTTLSTTVTDAGVSGNTSTVAPAIRGMSIIGTGPAAVLSSAGGPTFVSTDNELKSAVKKHYTKYFTTDAGGADSFTITDVELANGAGYDFKGVLIEGRLLQVETDHVFGSGLEGDVDIHSILAGFAFDGTTITEIAAETITQLFGSSTPTITAVTDGTTIIISFGDTYNGYRWTLDLDVTFV